MRHEYNILYAVQEIFMEVCIHRQRPVQLEVPLCKTLSAIV